MSTFFAAAELSCATTSHGGAQGREQRKTLDDVMYLDVVLSRSSLLFRLIWMQPMNDIG